MRLRKIFGHIGYCIVSGGFNAVSMRGGTKTANPTPSDNGTTTPPTEATSDKFVLGEQPLDFSFYGHYDWYTMPTWGEDAATKWIKENKKSM